jgi:hypothetical protein
MVLSRLQHSFGPSSEHIHQTPMPTRKILKYLLEILLCVSCIELQYSINNLLAAALVGGVETRGFGRGSEWPNNHPGWIRVKA